MLPKLECLLWRDTVVGCGPTTEYGDMGVTLEGCQPVGIVWWGLLSDEPQGGANGDSKINREIRNVTLKRWNI